MRTPFFDCSLHVLVLVLVLGTAGSAEAGDATLADAVAYLMSQQGDDGAWHSATYGSLRDGAALTSLVLYALARSPEPVAAAHRPQIARAFAFLMEGVGKSGYVCNPDGTIDLPTYASALTLTSSARLHHPLPDGVQEELLAYLIAAQLTETRGFRPGDPHYGGWDLSGAQRVVGQTSGTNVSLSRYVLEAFATTGGKRPEVAESVALARTWLRGCQNFPAGDGGFFYTPEAKLQGNKARDKAGRPRSYGSTTADGIACLLHAGAGTGSAQVEAAVRWIAEHPQVGHVPGFEDFDRPLGWELGLRYYYYSSLADVLPLLPGEMAGKIRARLHAEQREDGSWQNSASRMREDDPLLCTALAIIALAGAGGDR